MKGGGMFRSLSQAVLACGVLLLILYFRDGGELTGRPGHFAPLPASKPARSPWSRYEGRPVSAAKQSHALKTRTPAVAAAVATAAPSTSLKVNTDKKSLQQASAVTPNPVSKAAATAQGYTSKAVPPPSRWPPTSSATPSQQAKAALLSHVSQAVPSPTTPQKAGIATKKRTSQPPTPRPTAPKTSQSSGSLPPSTSNIPAPPKAKSPPPSSNRALVFFCADMHTGTTAEMSSMVISRGWKMVSASRSSIIHQEWMNAEQRAKFINLRATKPLPALLDGLPLNRHQTDLEANQRALFEYYKNDPVVRSVDAFVCTFPAALCEAFLPFNKTIIFAPAHRYTMRACTKEKWQHLTDVVKRLAKSTNPRHFVAAVSHYDAEYLNYFTGLKPLPLHSSSAVYVPKNPYKPTRPEILVGPLNLPGLILWGEHGQIPQGHVFSESNFTLVTARELYGRFALTQLIEHRAAVILPYAVMSYGMTELYTMGVPIFVPSEKWMKERPDYYPHDRTATQSNNYCGAGVGEDIVSPKDPASKHPFSPESMSEDARFYWLKLADYYQWPHIQFFDSIADLDNKLSTLNLTRIHEQMLEESAKRVKLVDRTWQTIADGIDRTPRITPTAFHPPDEFLAKL